MVSELGPSYTVIIHVLKFEMVVLDWILTVTNAYSWWVVSCIALQSLGVGAARRSTLGIYAKGLTVLIHKSTGHPTDFD